AEPWLTFMAAPGRRLPAAPRQDDASHTPLNRRLFVPGRAEAAVAGGQIWRPTADGLMPLQGRYPQRDVGRTPRMNVERGHDLMFRFLNGHQVSELVRFSDLAFANRHRVPFEEAEDFVGDVRVTAEDARAGLIDDPLDHRPHTRHAVTRGLYYPSH